jgi:hypothetical protein
MKQHQYMANFQVSIIRDYTVVFDQVLAGNSRPGEWWSRSFSFLHLDYLKVKKKVNK